MSQSRMYAALGALVALAVLPVRAHAQFTVTSDAGFASAYVWRGVTTTNRPVFQPDVVGAIREGSFTVVAGTWANVEPARYDAPGQISQGGGTRGGDVTEVDLWLELARDGSAGSFTFGGVQYVFPNSAGVTSAFNTFELYAKGGLALPLSPRVAVFQDVSRVSGTYVEAAVGQGVPLWGTTVSVGALVGYSVGEHEDAASSDVWYFSRDGVTHTDLSASASWTAGSLVIAPNVHLFVAHDPIVKVTAPGESHRTKIALGTTLSWARAFGDERH